MAIEVPQEQIEALRRRWKIRELALFGSVPRDDFRPDSDVDVMVEFETGYHPGHAGRLRMQDELTGLFGRDGDLVRTDLVENPIRRRHMVENQAVVFPRGARASMETDARPGCEAPLFAGRGA